MPSRMPDRLSPDRWRILIPYLDQVLDLPDEQLDQLADYLETLR